MESDLGARLVSAGLITRRQLREAIAQGPANQGKLVQALLAQGVAQDALCGYFIAMGHGPLVGGADLAFAERQALDRIHGGLAHAWSALPVRLTKAGLLTAMSAPSDRQAVAELTRAAGCAILPAVARPLELVRAIATSYGEEASAPVDLVRLRSGAQAERPAPPPPETNALPLVRRKRSPSEPELMTSASSAMGVVDEPFESRPLPSGPPRSQWDIEEEQAAMRSASPPPSLPSEAGDALAALRSATERDQVGEIVSDAARMLAANVVLLALRQRVLKGWRGGGTVIDADAIRNLWIPTLSPSMFRSVLSDGTPHLGVPGSTAADRLFCAVVGSRDALVAVYPIRVGTRVVAVLAASEPKNQDQAVEELEALAAAAGEALERIIVEKKRG